MALPKISIFLSYYNDADFLKTAIDAILNQSFYDFELILLNHATTDNCREIAHSYADERIVHIDKDFNYGAGCGLLIRDMLSVARGKYVKFCCADDLLRQDCLSVLFEYLEKNPNVDCVCSNMDFIDVAGKKINDQNYKFFLQELNTNTILRTLFNGDNVVAFPTVMVKKSVLNEIFIDTSFIMMLDLSLWAELLCRNYSFEKVNKKLVSYRIHGNQMSHICNNVSFIERIAFADIFYKIRNVGIVKYLCDDIKYVKNLSQKDEKYIPFVIALHHLQSDNLSFAISGYNYLHNLLNDEDARKDIENKFGFTIADFRNMYRRLGAMDNFLKVEGKKITAPNLLKLLARRIFRVFTPKFWSRKIKLFNNKHENTKIIRLKGGLGNQLYQWAFGVALGAKTGDNILYDTHWFDWVKGTKSVTRRGFELKYFIDNMNIADDRTIKRVQKKTIVPKFLRKILGVPRFKNVIYDETDTGVYKPELFTAHGDRYYDGYFSSEKYFADYKDALLKSFKLRIPMDKNNADMLKKIQGTDSVSVHIRRGDFIKFNYPLCTVEYYKWAMEQMSNYTKNPHFFIFSDDIQYVRENFDINENITIVDINDTEHGYFDFELMRNCRHNIIANSTFSAWAAILNVHQDGHVITPTDKKGALQ